MAGIDSATSFEGLQILDVRGLGRPMPTIRLGQAIRKVKVGEMIEMWTDDPGSLQNMSAWTRNTGHDLVAKSIEEGVYKYRVRRGR